MMSSRTTRLFAALQPSHQKSWRFGVVRSGAAHLDVPSLGHCGALCDNSPRCSGIEYGPTGRCEVWTSRTPMSSVLVRGFACIRKAYPGWAQTPPWGLVDGGVDQACRGDTTTDDLENYYIVMTDTSELEDCKQQCLMLTPPLVCYGIEHSLAQARCEVWTRPVHASASVDGFLCLAHNTGAGGGGPEGRLRRVRAEGR
mmetsp:Transcript_118919/g.381039  ORF Transcript_118919/g.381039 Transcript_118919/m.381039 type:complete len:199 (+) Transcript_118919:2416-3012(+)